MQNHNPVKAFDPFLNVDLSFPGVSKYPMRAMG